MRVHDSSFGIGGLTRVIALSIPTLGAFLVLAILLIPSIAAGPGPGRVQLANAPLRTLTVGAGLTAPPHTSGPSTLTLASQSLQKAWGFDPVSGPIACGLQPQSCASLIPPSKLSLQQVAPPPASNPFIPPAATGSAMAYDAQGSDPYVVLYGGLEQTTLRSGALSWHISGDTWSYVQGRWLNLTPFISGQTPGPRWDAMMTYDSSDGYLLLYGGCISPPINGLCGRSTGDTWSFDAGRWIQLAPSQPPPPPPGPGPPPPPAGPTIPNSRWDGALTWDDAITAPGGHTGAVVLFGGANGLRDNLTPANVGAQIHIWGDTWEWVAGVWTQLNPSTAPPPLYGARMATDTVTSTTILFGGTNAVRYDTSPVSVDFFAASNASGGASNDTWRLLSSGNWQKLKFSAPGPPGPAPPLPGPGARWDFVLATSGSAFSSTGDAILLMGGTNATGAVLDDSWIFQGAVQGWVVTPGPPSTAGTLTPSPRWGDALAFDGTDSVFLLFGGSSLSGSVLGDAWTVVLGGPWAPSLPSHAGPASPGPRYSASAAFDDIAHTGVLFGGESCGASSCTFLGDTWTYAQGEWSPLQLGLAPAPRFGAAFAYYPTSKSVVLFGGCGVVCPLGDTWLYTAPEFGTGTWTQIFSPVAPPARYFATLSYVSTARQLVLFGGCEGSVGPCPAGDTWLFSGSGTWKHDTSSLTGNLPPARFGAAAASVPNAGTILFGGMGVGGPLQDTWNYSLFQPSGAASSAAAVLGWHPESSRTTPPPRVFGSLAFDRVENWLVLFGGCEPSACPAQDPWIFNITKPPPPPGGGTPPANPWKVMPFIRITGPAVVWNVTLAPEYGVAAFWDPIESSEGYIVAFGGRGITGGTHGGTFSFVGDYWYDLSPFV